MTDSQFGRGEELYSSYFALALKIRLLLYQVFLCSVLFMAPRALSYSFMWFVLSFLRACKVYCLPNLCIHALCLFTGHGGARAAEYVKQNLFSNLISHPKFISDTKSAIG